MRTSIAIDERGASLPSPRASWELLVILGLRRASEGAAVRGSAAFAVLTGLVVGAIGAYAVRGGGYGAPIAESVTLACSAVAWGGGTLAAVGGSMRALLRDREDGIVLLTRHRGHRAGGYLMGRVIGLGLVLAAIVFGGTLIATLVIATTLPWALIPRALLALGAAAAYSLAFGAVVAAVAFAALAPRERVGGYLTLLAVLALPDLLARGLAPTIDDRTRELLSIPGALAALRGGLLVAAWNPWRTLRATLVLVAVVACAAAILRAMRPDGASPLGDEGPGA